jgi:catechol 2,3-dioxygenase-like lactoylglutathione lyase family enzyme
MIHGGNATIYVSDMDRSIRFYTETLGLKLKQRFGNKWAEVDAGPGLTIGLHPPSEHVGVKPGQRGATQVGLLVSRPLDEVVKTLRSRGVTLEGSIGGGEGGRFAMLADPDGNPLYLWELAPANV